METLPFAVEDPGEKVVVKQTFDGFHNADLLPYLRERGKRFLLTAGLVTSTCALLTTASATQLGFLTAVVEDCCADEPTAHEDTLERYQFIFDRVMVDQIVDRYSAWLGPNPRNPCTDDKDFPAGRPFRFEIDFGLGFLVPASPG